MANKVITLLEDVQKKLDSMKREHRLKKEKSQFDSEVNRLAMQADCRGSLRLCMDQMNWTIKEQSENIKLGKRKGMSTTRQEQILWDSALGYLLIKEADYSMSSVSDNETVVYAYSVLDEAMRQISGNKASAKALFKKKLENDKLTGKYMTSDALRKEKEAILDEIFEQLVVSGDIERELKRRNANLVGKGQSKNSMEDRFNAIPDSARSEKLSPEELQNLSEIHTVPRVTEAASASSDKA